MKFKIIVGEIVKLPISSYYEKNKLKSIYFMQGGKTPNWVVKQAWCSEYGLIIKRI